MANGLIDSFRVGGKKKKKTAKREYVFNGRKVSIEKNGSEWDGWFEDDHSVTYTADTKGELLADIESDSGG
jgi:hypothetical protein